MAAFVTLVSAIVALFAVVATGAVPSKEILAVQLAVIIKVLNTQL